MRKGFRHVLLAGAAASAALWAQGAIAAPMISGPAPGSDQFFDLMAHPNGSAEPPTYLLRLEGLEFLRTGAGGPSDTWTFGDCFDADCGVTAMYDASEMSFRISGVALGGLDTGATYDGGGVKVELDFLIDFDAIDAADGATEFSDPGDGMLNFTVFSTSAGDIFEGAEGSVRFLDSYRSFAQDHTVGLQGFSKSSGSGGLYSVFEFLTDQHRIFDDCNPVETLSGDKCNNPVGRGWVIAANANDEFVIGERETPQDFLFVDPIAHVPAPSSIALFGLGLAGVGAAGLHRRGRKTRVRA